MRIIKGRTPEGALIRAFRIRANLSQARLNEILGRSSGFIGQVEASCWRTNLRALGQIARALNLSLGEEQQLLAAREQPWDAPPEPTMVVHIGSPREPVSVDRYNPFAAA